MIKKIGLSVCYDTKNFGSQLQVLATINKIEQLGYKTEIIRYKKKLSLKFIYQTLPRFLNGYFIDAKINRKKKKKELNKHPEIYENVKIRNKRFDKFVEKNFTNLSENYCGWDELVHKSNENYDVFLCGSDQLWLPGNLGSHFYTLEYANNKKKKIAYATSFGVSQIPWYQKARTKKYLNEFSFLSCREEKGTKIIKELTGKEVPVVVDPTLLLSKEEWENLIPVDKVLEEKYIFCYLLGGNVEHRKIAEELSKNTGYKIVTIPFLDNYVEYDENFGDYRMYDVDSSDFVNLIRNAEYVLTDSFHGSIFSIINHKKFVTLNRFLEGSKNSRNSRIDNLCSMLELNDRRYSDDILKIKNDIDYDKVDILLNDIKIKSIKYLEQALKKSTEEFL